MEKRIPSPPPSSVLVVCLRLIGDVILSTPLVGLLKAAWPDAAVDYLVNRGTGEFLEKDPRVRRVLFAEGGDGSRPGRPVFGGYAARIFRKYDAAINLNASDRGNLAAVLAGRRIRLGFHQSRGVLRDGWKTLFLTHPVPYPFSTHVARIAQLVAEELGIPVQRLEAKVFWDAGDEAAVSALLAGAMVSGPFFVVHPFARWRYKYWKAERFADVSDAIAARHGLVPVWTSSPEASEIALLKEAASLCRRPPAILAGKLGLNGMACLLARCTLYLGLDTAVSHLAATTGVPMVVLYGPTIAERWSPWNNDGPVAQQCPLPRGVQRTGGTILVQKDWDCIPCGKAGCDDRGGESRCMSGIEVAEVLDAVDTVLGPIPARSQSGER